MNESASAARARPHPCAAARPYGAARSPGAARARRRARAPLSRPRETAALQPRRRSRGRAGPEPVAAFRALIGASDAIVIAVPEYAHGLPGVLKNALDWLVASETFASKPVVLVNASSRAFHAQAALREILATMGARLLPEAFASLPLTGRAVTAEDVLSDAACARLLKESLDALIDALQPAPVATAPRDRPSKSGLAN